MTADEISALAEQVKQRANHYGDARSRSGSGCTALWQILTAAIHALRDAAIDRLAADQASAQGWQDISTAPKELGFAFLGNANEGWTEQGWWDGERSEWWPLNCHHTDSFGQALNATHWQPLPAAPALRNIPADSAAGDGVGEAL